jgi:hypothetical protein
LYQQRKIQVAQQTISIGSTANDGTGDSLRVAFNKINSMFTELYGETAADSQISFSGNKISSNVSNANLVLEASGTGAIELEGIQIRDNHIEGTRSNEDLNITASGTGAISLEGLKIRDNHIEATRSNDNLILSASGTGNILLGAVKINGTTLSSDDSSKISIAEAVDVNGNLVVTGSQIDFTNLPTSDPGTAGRLYRDGATVKVSI